MLRLLFAVTLFVSAALLFVVQPMVAKMVLPLLGGTPAVWITCMVFFQGLLLAGYLYAHATTSWLGARKQATLHLVLLLVPLAALPFIRLPLQLSAAAGSTLDSGPLRLLGPIPTEGNPTLWLIGLLLLCIGLPFFAVSTSAPLLQKWFAGTGHPDAADPYFLYGASNLGSMLALLGYPAVIEPFLHVPTQTTTWAAGYALLLLLTGACAVSLWRASPTAAVVSVTAMKQQKSAASTVTAWQRLYWVALAFVPSSLLLGVTTYMSTDLAAIPLLWVIPLALYLLTFILAFARRTWLPPNLLVWLLPALVLGQLVFLIKLPDTIWPILVLHLLTFFVASLICHGELARRRPDTEHLTEFYLWMSFGGVLGGLFSAVVAPLVFNTVAEYPLELALACVVGPPIRGFGRADRPLTNLGLPIVGGVIVAVFMINFLTSTPGSAPTTWLDVGLIAFLALLSYAAVACFTVRPLLFGMSVGFVILAGEVGAGVGGELLYQKRTFFGVSRVAVEAGTDKSKVGQGMLLHLLYHDTTLHGAECLDPGRRDEPLTYYHRKGPIGQVFESLAQGPARPVAVVGLGTGTLAAYGRPGQEFDFYDINPEVARIARDPRYFYYLKDTRARAEIILGDGRLALARASDGRYGLIILDAFSSDAIPVHLLTRQAVEDVYLHKLAPGGIIAFHISNRYLDLEPVLADVAAAAGLICRIEHDPADVAIGKTQSVWVIMARSTSDLGVLNHDERWTPLEAAADRTVWTDDFSNVLRIVKWHGD